MTEPVPQMETDVLLSKRDGPITTIVLNRPARHNAISQAMKDAFAAVWRDIGSDPDVRVVVITGAGEKAFCSGADVKEMSAKGDRAREAYPPAMLTARHAGVFKPTIVAVNGVCAGGGLHFVADGDIVIASENATFLDPHVHVGQVSALEPIGLAARGVSLGVVLRMVLLGRAQRLDAQHALASGLVTEVVPADRLMDRAHELARTVASASPAAVQASLRAIWNSRNKGLETGLREGWDEIMEHWSHPDAVEGPRAFAEKRTPGWTVD